MGGESGLNDNAVASLLVLDLFLGTLAMLMLGHRLGRKSLAEKTDAVHSRPPASKPRSSASWA